MSASLAYDGSYFRSISGILKICCLCCYFIGFLCIMCSPVHFRNLRGLVYISVVTLSTCCTLGLLLTHLFQLWQRKFLHFNVAKYEAFSHVLLALMLFIISGMVLSLDVATYSVAAFFSYFAFSYHTCDAYICYRLSRKSDAATQTDYERPSPQVRHM